MPGLDQEEEEEAPPPVLVVASTGPSAQKQPRCMGEYRLTEQRSAGRAVYKHWIWKVYRVFQDDLTTRNIMPGR